MPLDEDIELLKDLLQLLDHQKMPSYEHALELGTQALLRIQIHHCTSTQTLNKPLPKED